jgi:hypothetical protein
VGISLKGRGYIAQMKVSEMDELIEYQNKKQTKKLKTHIDEATSKVLKAISKLTP